MHHLLSSVHILAAIVFLGGSGVATSLFPRYTPLAATTGHTPVTTAAGDRGNHPAGMLSISRNEDPCA